MRLERFVATGSPTGSRWYNTDHRHRMLGGRTPLAGVDDDPAALQRVDAGPLRHLHARRHRAQRAEGRHPVHAAWPTSPPSCTGRGGQRVQMRYMPHDDRSIEVYLDGEHLCTAYPQGQLTRRRPTRSARTPAPRPSGSAPPGAARPRRARAELAPLTGDETGAAESRLVPAAGARDCSAAATTTLLRRPRLDQPARPDRPHRPDGDPAS